MNFGVHEYVIVEDDSFQVSKKNIWDNIENIPLSSVRASVA